MYVPHEDVVEDGDNKYHDDGDESGDGVGGIVQEGVDPEAVDGVDQVGIGEVQVDYWESN